jgi:hypothetical protein
MRYLEEEVGFEPTDPDFSRICSFRDCRYQPLTHSSLYLAGAIGFKPMWVLSGGFGDLCNRSLCDTPTLKL